MGKQGCFCAASYEAARNVVCSAALKFEVHQLLTDGKSGTIFGRTPRRSTGTPGTEKVICSADA